MNFSRYLKMQKEEYLKDNASLMLQIGNCWNNHLIINVFFKIRHKGRDRFLTFCFFCNQKQRKMNYKMNGEEYMSN